MAWNGLTVVGLVMLILGMIAIIIGIVLYEQNVQNREDQQWYVWLTFVVAGILVIVGTVLMLVGLRKPTKIIVNNYGLTYDGPSPYARTVNVPTMEGEYNPYSGYGGDL